MLTTRDQQQGHDTHLKNVNHPMAPVTLPHEIAIATSNLCDLTLTIFELVFLPLLLDFSQNRLVATVFDEGVDLKKIQQPCKGN